MASATLKGRTPAEAASPEPEPPTDRYGNPDPSSRYGLGPWSLVGRRWEVTSRGDRWRLARDGVTLYTARVGGSGSFHRYRPAPTSPTWKAWAFGLAEHQGVTIAELVLQLLEHHARRVKYDGPRPTDARPRSTSFVRDLSLVARDE